LKGKGLEKILFLEEKAEEAFRNVTLPGAYLEIFRERSFETFLYGWENLGEDFGIFFLKKP